MSNCNIKELFDENRYPSGWKALFLLVYSPVGLLLAVLRMLIALQAFLFAMVLPQIPVVKNFVLRSLCAALGIIVKQENEGARDESARLLVANHVSRCDHIAVHLATGSVSANSWEIPAAYSWALGMKDLGVHQGRDALVNNIRGHLEKCPGPVLCLPEGATTNGRVGLLKFVSWPFCLADAIQPVAVRVWRPSVAEVAPTALATSAWADIFWFLFVPCTVFTLKFLPVVKRENGEGEEVVAEKVAQLIAKELGVVKTQHTAADRAEYEKRWTAEQNHPLVVHTRTMSIGNVELQRMAQQVTEVLPNVPQETILRDLARTRNVDLTISNILEGVVTYIPVQVSPSTTQEPSSKSTSTSTSSSSSNTTSCGTSSTNTFSTSTAGSAPLSQPSTSSPQLTGGKSGMTSSACLDTSAPSFPRSAQERMLSFNERKARLIENARQRYIEKHGLKNVGLNC